MARLWLLLSVTGGGCLTKPKPNQGCNAFMMMMMTIGCVRFYSRTFFLYIVTAIFKANVNVNK